MFIVLLLLVTLPPPRPPPTLAPSPARTRILNPSPLVLLALKRIDGLWIFLDPDNSFLIPLPVLTGLKCGSYVQKEMVYSTDKDQEPKLRIPILLLGEPTLTRLPFTRNTFSFSTKRWRRWTAVASRQRVESWELRVATSAWSFLGSSSESSCASSELSEHTTGHLHRATESVEVRYRLWRRKPAWRMGLSSLKLDMGADTTSLWWKTQQTRAWLSFTDLKSDSPRGSCIFHFGLNMRRKKIFILISNVLIIFSEWSRRPAPSPFRWRLQRRKARLPGGRRCAGQKHAAAASEGAGAFHWQGQWPGQAGAARGNFIFFWNNEIWDPAPLHGEFWWKITLILDFEQLRVGPDA